MLTIMKKKLALPDEEGKFLKGNDSQVKKTGKLKRNIQSN